MTDKSTMPPLSPVSTAIASALRKARVGVLQAHSNLQHTTREIAEAEKSLVDDGERLIGAQGLVRELTQYFNERNEGAPPLDMGYKAVEQFREAMEWEPGPATPAPEATFVPGRGFAPFPPTDVVATEKWAEGNQRMTQALHDMPTAAATVDTSGLTLNAGKSEQAPTGSLSKDTLDGAERRAQEDEAARLARPSYFDRVRPGTGRTIGMDPGGDDDTVTVLLTGKGDLSPEMQADLARAVELDAVGYTDGGPNPHYEGLHEGETQEQAEKRRADAGKGDPWGRVAYRAEAAKPKVIPPTIGRRVWFWPSDNTVEGRGMRRIEYAVPMDAGVVFVWNDRLVNLDVTDHDGKHHAITSVTLVQPGEGRPMNGPYATWMDYQIGAAK